jgi:Zn finger protein HypA/HybF involved in hydrogenase expression
MTTAPNTKKPRPAGVRLRCNECGRTWRVSPKALDPACPRCGGVDWDVLDEPAHTEGRHA